VDESNRAQPQDAVDGLLNRKRFAIADDRR
jgi:hypothetical protein